MKIEEVTVARLALKPGERLLVQCEQKLPMEMVDRLRDLVASRLDIDPDRILVLSDGLKATVLEAQP